MNGRSINSSGRENVFCTFMAEDLIKNGKENIEKQTQSSRRESYIGLL